MTPYERGFADCRERAARECEELSVAAKEVMVKAVSDRCRQAILSLQLEAPASQPEGVVVPREPTEKMLEAAKREWNDQFQDCPSFKSIYRAMIAAAKEE